MLKKVLCQRGRSVRRKNMAQDIMEVRLCDKEDVSIAKKLLKAAKKK